MSFIAVHYYQDTDGVEWFSKHAVRLILGISQRRTLNSYLKELLGELGKLSEKAFQRYLEELIGELPDSTIKQYGCELAHQSPSYFPVCLIQVLCRMQAWLQAGNGLKRHSKKGFVVRLRTKTWEREFRKSFIPIELKLQHLETQIQKARVTYGYQTYQTSAITVRASAVA